MMDAQERRQLRALQRNLQERRDREALAHARARREALSPEERAAEDAERDRLRKDVLGGIG